MPMPSVADHRAGVDADPRSDRWAQEVDGEVGVDEHVGLPRQHSADAVGEVGGGRHTLQWARLLAGDHRHEEADPHRDRAGLEPGPGGEAVLDAVVVEGDVVVGEAAEPRAATARARAGEGRARAADRRAAAPAPTGSAARGPGPPRCPWRRGAPSASTSCTLRPGRTTFASTSRGSTGTGRSSSMVRRATSKATPSAGARLDRPRQQRPGRAAVEGPRVPGATREVGRDDAVPVGLEQRVGHVCSGSRASATSARWPTSSPPGGSSNGSTTNFDAPGARRRRRCGGPASAARPGRARSGRGRAGAWPAARGTRVGARSSA